MLFAAPAGMTQEWLRRCLAALALFLSFAITVGSQQLPAPEAWAALEQGDASKAAAIFRDALDRSPGDAVLHYGSAQASLALGRTEAAISSLKHAIEYNPRFVQAMVQLAQVAYKAADLDLAVRTLEKAAALTPGNRDIAGTTRAVAQGSHAPPDVPEPARSAVQRHCSKDRSRRR